MRYCSSKAKQDKPNVALTIIRKSSELIQVSLLLRRHTWRGSCIALLIVTPGAGSDGRTGLYLKLIFFSSYTARVRQRTRTDFLH